METVAVANASNTTSGPTTFVLRDNKLWRSDFTLNSSFRYSNEQIANALPKSAGCQLGFTTLKPGMLDSVETSPTENSLPGRGRTMLTCQIDVTRRLHNTSVRYEISPTRPTSGTIVCRSDRLPKAMRVVSIVSWESYECPDTFCKKAPRNSYRLGSAARA